MFLILYVPCYFLVSNGVDIMDGPWVDIMDGPWVDIMDGP